MTLMENYAALLESLKQQEQELQFATFTNETALALGLKVVELARQQGKAVATNITRNGLVLFHHAMDGTFGDQADWIRRKNNVVARWGHSSYYVGVDHKRRNAVFEDAAHYDIKDYAAHGGAFPLIIRHVGIVGTVTVSGLPQAEDHALAVEAIRAVIQAGTGL
jgi:uncharacterized protein (UPF0303 family)